MKQRDGQRGNRSHHFKTNNGAAFHAYAHWWMAGLSKWWNRRRRPTR